MAALMLPWVMDRRLHELDPTNSKAVFRRTVQMLGLALVWPVTALLLGLTNGILAARGFDRQQEGPAGSGIPAPRRRGERSPRFEPLPPAAELPPLPSPDPDWLRKRDRPPPPESPAEQTLAEPSQLSEHRARRSAPEPAAVAEEPGTPKPVDQPPVVTP